MLLCAALGAGLAACSIAPAPQPTLQALPFILVTHAPNPTPTATPFQPQPPTPNPFPPLEATPTAVPVDDLTPTPSATATAPPPTPIPPPTLDPSATLPPVPALEGYETINFLLIGSDKRPGSSYRTDTLVIVILRPKDGQVTMISIPRDLWVYIPDYGMQRINTAYQTGEISDYPAGGPGLLKATILYNLGIPIDHTAMVEFDGFRRIVDTLGGVDVPVACAYTDWRLIDPSYNPYNENNWYLYTAGPGVVHMDGDLALWYARSRMRSSDFDRGRRQQEVLRALFTRILQGDALSRVPELYEQLKGVVVTDLGLADLLQLALYAPRLSNADIRSYYIRPPLVSAWITDQGAYVLSPNNPALQNMLAEAMAPSPRAVEQQSIVIEVQNGTPFEGWDTLAAQRLNYTGYETRIVPPDRNDYAYSVLMDLTLAQDAGQSAQILSMLGMMPGSLVPFPDPNSRVHYRLIIGYDYQPCFSPDQLSH